MPSTKKENPEKIKNFIVQSETRLQEHIQWLKHRVHQLSQDYAKKFTDQTFELTTSLQEIDNLNH